MSVADLLINIIIFLVQRFLLILPTSISWLPIEEFNSTLAGVQNNLIFSLSGIGFFMPILLILSLVLLIIFAELSLVIFKAGVWIINVVRGSGA